LIVPSTLGEQQKLQKHASLTTEEAARGCDNYTMIDHNSYTSPDIVRVNNSRMVWLENVARTEKLKMRIKYWSRNHKGRYYEGRLLSSWTHLITPSRNFVEVRWRSLLLSTSLAKRCTSYNAPPTSRKNVLQTV